MTPKLDDYYIFVDENKLDSIYQNPKQDIYIPIIIVHNSDTVKSAKLRIRGDTSRDDPKKSLKVKFKKNEILPGEKRKINFNAEYSDKSMIRQYLSSITMQQAGIVCFKTSFARLFVNGNFFGLYSKIENVDDRFLFERGLSINNNLYKAKKDGACLSNFDDIDVKWEKKTNKKSNKDDLKILIENINNLNGKSFTDYVKEHFNYDELVSLIAVNMLISNGSTYYHNYYLYHDSRTQKWTIFPWDMDKTFSYYDWMPYDYTRTSSHWESDNPLIEKCILSDEIFSDIKMKINEFHKQFFNSDFYTPIINKLEVLLKDAIKNDTTDQIENVSKWEHVIDNEKIYISNRYDKLQQQFNDWPSTFQLIDFTEPIYGLPKFVWTASKSKRGKTITYNLYYGTDFLLENKTTHIIKNIKDTFFILNEFLLPGKYYWRVEATDGDKAIEGFNTKSTFEIKEMKFTTIPATIDKDMVLMKQYSPYLIDQDVTVMPNIDLAAEPGVTIFIKDSSNIWVKGSINFIANSDENIFIKPLNQSMYWGFIFLVSTTAPSKLEFVNIVDGLLNAKDADLNLFHVSLTIVNKKLDLGNDIRKSIVWFNRGNFSMKNCQVWGNGKGEGLNINYAKTIIKDCFITNVPDGIELINVRDSKIESNWIQYSPDDAIDLDSCYNILIKNNVMYKCKDKGISVGTEQYGPSRKIVAENNLIINNLIGVGIKDSSEIFLNHNTIVNCQKGILAKVKRKDFMLGGYAKVENCILFNCEKPIQVMDKSKIEVSYTLSNNENIAGKKNIFSTPKFRDKDKYDFSLITNSVGSASASDKKDMGAYDSKESTKILNSLVNKYYKK